MISQMSRGLFTFLLMGMLYSLLVSAAHGATSFVRVPLGMDASIEVPKNWKVLSENENTTLDALVEAKGYQHGSAKFSYRANLYDDSGKTLATVNVRLYPDHSITQEEVRQLSSADLKVLDLWIRKTVEESMKSTGVHMLQWYGSRMQVINGVSVLVHEFEHSGASGRGATRVRGVRVWNGSRSFTVTFSYEAGKATLLMPIIDYMAQSLRQQ